MSHTIYRKNDNTIEWTWMNDSRDGSFINNGTVTYRLYSGYSLNPATGALNTPGGAVNVSVHGPITMTYVPGSNGKYQAILPASLNLNLALAYTLEINATAGSLTARRSIPVTVVDRN